MRNLRTKKALADQQRLDRNMLGAHSIVHSLFQARLPTELMDENATALAALNLPPIFSKTIETGKFFSYAYL